MQTRWTMTSSSGAAFFLCACLTTPATLNAKAASVERLQCPDAKTSQDDQRVLETTTVLRVNGQYLYTFASGGGKVTGTELVVRPPEGVSSERMTRVLQCHGAQAFLGHIDPARYPNDPYWLPDAWVDIDVKSQWGNFVATLRADTVSDNLRIMRRATAFAATHRRVAPNSGL
jgi:hypothetical protein